MIKEKNNENELFGKNHPDKENVREKTPQNI